MSISAVYRPRRGDVLLIDGNGDTFAIPAREADGIAAAIRVAARTPTLAAQLQAARGRSEDQAA